MPRAARARAGKATCGRETARGRVWGVVGWRGRVLVVGRVSGGCVPAGVAPVRHACKVLDAWSADRATASAGRVRGQVQGGRVGEHQGGSWQLQDMVVAGFGAGLEQDGMGVACQCQC